jgi:hypothetical protein
MRFLVPTLVVMIVPGLAAQEVTSPSSRVDTAVSSSDRSPFRRLELPAPNRIRNGSGAPGPEYWQQRVDYVIRATLDTVARKVSGQERISYLNRSPDTLRYLWLQLDQNLFTAGSRGSLLFDQGSRFGTQGAEGGITLTQVAEPAARAAAGRPAQPAKQLHYLVNGTMMKVDLSRPLQPGGLQVIEIGWSFPFGPNSNRMGIEQIDGSTV